MFAEPFLLCSYVEVEEAVPGELEEEGEAVPETLTHNEKSSI